MCAIALSRFSSADGCGHGDSLENSLGVPELRVGETPGRRWRTVDGLRLAWNCLPHWVLNIATPCEGIRVRRVTDRPRPSVAETVRPDVFSTVIKPSFGITVIAVRSRRACRVEITTPAPEPTLHPDPPHLSPGRHLGREQSC